ncbi:hypothetical protein HPB50_001599 [Hyalomma asiaticum]|uniref:Uncharacterized protein n=1 Tax=Hyalomma asiaticum TaxID=266040 RepID=A0ACB7RY36_HYAAI|nr:hypothetical protein HPB50_001599 [Hyalomma asiaticum]
MLGAVLVSSLVISLAKHDYRLWKGNANNKRRWVYDFCETVWELIANILCEASAVTPTSGPARIVTGAFWVLVIVMSTSFAGQMKASMMVKKETDRVDSVRDIARRPSLKPYLPQGSSIVTYIRDSQEPSYQRVWRMAQRHASVLPIKHIVTPKAMREAMRSEAVMIASRASHSVEGEKACTANDTRGELYVGRTPFYTFNSVLYLNRRLEPWLREGISNRILRLLEAGVIQKWWRESAGQWEGCGQADSGDTLSFENFQGIFALCAGVLCLAATCLLLECAVAAACKTRR